MKQSKPKHIPKTWGSELWIHNGPDYTFKILVFLPRSSGSMHYHLQKTETWYVESGRFLCVQADPKTGRHISRPLRHGDTVHLPAGTAHQLHCLEAGRIFEASTPHQDSDTYRVSPSIKP